MSVTNQISAAAKPPAPGKSSGRRSDERTLQILDRRRRTAVVKRRGWLVRRMLLLADVVGLVGALLVAQWLDARQSTAPTPTRREVEILAFLATLPLWIVFMKLYGLYDRDEEQTDHSTVDEVVGVFHLVTVGAWLSVVTSSDRHRPPGLRKLAVFWAAAHRDPLVCRATARATAGVTQLPAEHPHDRRRRRGQTSRRSSSTTPSTGSTLSPSSTPRPERPIELEHMACSTIPATQRRSWRSTSSAS